MNHLFRAAKIHRSVTEEVIEPTKMEWAIPKALHRRKTASCNLLLTETTPTRWLSVTLPNCPKWSCSEPFFAKLLKFWIRVCVLDRIKMILIVGIRKDANYAFYRAVSMSENNIYAVRCPWKISRRDGSLLCLHWTETGTHLWRY